MHPELKNYPFLKEVIGLYFLLSSWQDNINDSIKLPEKEIDKILKKNLSFVKQVVNAIRFPLQGICSEISFEIIKEKTPAFAQEWKGFQYLAHTIIYAMEIQNLNFRNSEDIKKCHDYTISIIYSLLSYYHESSTKGLSNDLLAWIKNDVHIDIDALSLSSGH
ncbi:hypothetical protein MK079_03710 [Candidatus Gracilibacteria bacterium]|nr:hypothetical protein [Candidatus Gracilibacteria bacterium]